MRIQFSVGRTMIFAVAALMLSACTDYPPVAASECGKVVQHAQKVLVNFEPDYADLMKSCKEASDSERGCAMAATKAGQIAQCM